MKRSTASFVATFIVLLFLLAPLMGTAAAKTPTPMPATSNSATSLPFSGGTTALSGTIFDDRGNGIANAKVTLYYTVWVGTDYKAKDPVKINDVLNPQYTGDGGTLPTGRYVYTNVPPGVYVLTAEKGGISVSKNIMVTGGTATENLVIAGYIEGHVTPTPVPSSVPSSKPSPAPSGTQGPDIGALLMDLLRFGLMGIVGVQLIASVFVIVIQAGRRY